MKIANLSVNRPIMMSMIIIVFVLFGGMAYFSLSLNNMPDVQIPYVTISTVYAGAGPKEIETQVTKKIEDAVSTISKVKVLESYSLEGVSIVIMEFQIGKDVDLANREVKDKVDAIISELPDDVEKPVIQKVDLQAFPVVDVVLSGSANTDPRDLYRVADRTLRDKFSQVDGVANVTITGGQEREIQVRLDNRTVYENSISLPQLVQILKANNIDIPGGYFKLEGQEYTVRLQGQYPSTNSMNDISIPTASGLKKLSQLGYVYDQGKDVRQRAIYFDNRTKTRRDNIVKLGIVKASDGNVVSVAEDVKAAIPEIQKVLPKGMKLEMVKDQSKFIKASVDDAVSNIYLGVILTALVLFFFLHDIRSTFIVALAMPISIVSTFWAMSMSNFSLNTMSLMGISVSVGVLVTNAVVVIENIFRYKEMGYNKREAASKGTDEIVVAVLASTLTNLVVFLPIAQMGSMIGLFFREFALTVTYATLFSLMISFTVTPMLSALFLPEKIELGRFSMWIEKYWGKVEKIYGKTLSIMLGKKRYAIFTVATTFLAFLLTMALIAPNVGFENFPTIDDSEIRASVELPEGYNLDESAKVMAEIERRLTIHPEVLQMTTSLGSQGDLNTGTNLATIDITLCDPKDRTEHISVWISRFIKELSDIPNAKIKVDYASTTAGPGSPIEMYLLGDNLDKLDELKNIVVAKLQDVPGLVNFDNTSRSGKPEITVFPYRDKIAEAGLTVTDIAMTLRASMEGLISTRYREAGEEYDLKVNLTDESYNTPEKVGNITISSPYGSFRLAQLADIKFTTGYTKILHRSKAINVKFTGSPAAGVPLGDVTAEIEKRMQTIKMPDGFSYKWGGDAQMMQETTADMIRAFLLAIVLTYMLLAALLEDLIQPLIIMSTLPLSFIGVIFALWFTGTTMNTISMMAIIMLIGIVVNNAILLLDYSNQLIRDEGLTRREALIKAAPVKLKPQIMATLAIILGMFPILIGMGDAGKEIRSPLGIVSTGGLIFSTFLTLYIIPAADMLNSAAGAWIGRRFKKKPKTA